MAINAKIAKSISIPEESDGVVEDDVTEATEGQSLGLTVAPPLAVPCPTICPFWLKSVYGAGNDGKTLTDCLGPTYTTVSPTYAIIPVPH